MEKIEVKPSPSFHVLAGTERSEVATMVLGPGNTTGGPENRHTGSDQWLFVLAGQGRAVVEGKEVELWPGTLLLIEAGEAHQIDNTGDRLLETLNFYAPPEF
jgi:mannose-6-phosphate isomerase-like protein (cupin superfamily)